MSDIGDRADAFHAVAALLGIETQHTDALGVIHTPDAETLAAMAAAFGLPCDPQQAAAALAEMGRVAPLGLDPLQIVPAEAPALALDPTGVVEWRLVLENGGDAEGRWNPGDGLLRLPDGTPLGYHRLDLATGGAATTVTIAVAPAFCHLPAALQPGARSWGLTTQLYGLRGGRGWGMGDFTDLAELSRAAGSLGAVSVGINPLHALFASEPRHSSPYSPSSRSQLDYLYIDPAAVPGFADPAIRALAPAAVPVDDGGLVDHAAVAALKRPVLEALYCRFRDVDLKTRTKHGKAFRRFQREGGEALVAFATFEALHEVRNVGDGQFSWHDWPSELRDPRSRAVAEFVEAHKERVEFFQFLQWQADTQLGAAAKAGRTAGLSLGLYRDLAVGVNPQGAEAWADQGLVVPGMGIGAPPDALSRAGQAWGLAPVNPLELRRRGFQPFIAALRANMRHAGVLRIDHVMSLQRLYWVPAGRSAVTGAYVRYPFAELLRLVSLESHRQQCAVVGEDLGTVPSGFRETMQAANVLSYRVVMFERRRDGNFISPGDYPPLAAASAATHDLATLKGFWLGRDIAWRQRLSLYPDVAAEAADISDRHTARWQLLEALARDGLIAWERFGEFLPHGDEPVFTAELGGAILAFLARSRARLMLVQIEDVAGEVEQANLPGTSDAHPNWRRRLSAPLAAILNGPDIRRIAALMSEERARAVR
ncbi:MAG TPA: 4-alpha-glucanotransferase [Stellaceae bacterium]|jgi:4-alpha-glucanotransferase|nr:4-alpha-glucanotransferase [Stellaceae bacterium]